MSPNEHSRTDPSFAESHSEFLAELFEEFTDRLNKGEQPSVEAYVRDNPHHAETLRDVLPALAAMHSSDDITSSESSTSAQPREIGEYRILREVGRGGMARVYEARHSKLKRRVALKVLAHHSDDPGMLRRFEREARAVANLHHTNIVPVYETGECDGQHYIAMQFIGGSSLDRVLRHPIASTTPRMAGTTAPVRPSTERNKPRAEVPSRDSSVPSHAAAPVHEPASVDPDEPLQTLRGLLGLSNTTANSPDYQLIARIGQRVSEAIAFAHQHGVLHRDIKPSNLLLDEQGEVWVTDFGLARIDDEGLTKTGDIVGTLRYMAPERFSGDCDERSDVYGIGISLYEMITGRQAFAQAERAALVRQICESTPPAPGAIRTDIPRDLETIVQKAIAHDAASRYQSANDLAEDLRCFAKGLPISARPWTPLQRLSQWCKRNPVPALLSAALCLSLITGLALFGWQFYRTLDANDRLEKANSDLIAANRREHDALSEALLRTHEAELAQGLADESRLLEQNINEFLVDSFRIDFPGSAGKDLTLFAVLQRSDRHLQQTTELGPIVRGSLLLAIAKSYHGLGLYDDAQRVLESCLTLLPPDDEKHFDARLVIIETLVDLTEFDEAKQQMEELREELLEKFGERAKLSQQANNIYALILIRTGESQTALSILEAQRDWQTANVDGYSTEKMVTLSNLALALESKGEFEKARGLYEAVLALAIDNGLDDNFTAATARNNLALIHLKLREPEKAGPLMEQALEQRKRLLGEQHPYTLSAMNNLAGVHFNSGKLTEAVDILRDVVSLMEAANGTDHQDTIDTRFNLGGLLMTIGKTEEAIPLFRTSVEVMERKAGPEDAKTVKFRSNLARALEENGDLEEAEATLRSLIAIERKATPVKELNLSGKLESLGRVLIAAGKAADAEAPLRESLKYLEGELLPREQWRFGPVCSSLGECLMNQEKYEEAETLLLRGEAVLSDPEIKAPKFPHDRAVKASLRRLAEFYEQLGNAEKAAEFRQRLKELVGEPQKD